MPGTVEAAPARESEHNHDDVPIPSGADASPGEAMQSDVSPVPEIATTPAGTDQSPGNAPAPAPSRDLAASRYYDAATIAAADRDLRREHGGMTFSQIFFNIAEYQARRGGDGYRWDGEAWIGGDINRLPLKSEGDGTFGKSSGQIEVQALYSRALDPYWNLQAGVRYDLKRNPSRTYAAIGIEGLAPYWFNVEGTIFLSDSGGCIWPRRGLVRSTRGAVCRASAVHRSEFRSAGRCA